MTGSENTNRSLRDTNDMNLEFLNLLAMEDIVGLIEIQLQFEEDI